MRHKRFFRAWLPLLAGGAILVAGCGSGGSSSQSGQSSGSSAILQMSGEGEVTIYTRNFNPFSPDANLGTTTAIYEPLVVYTPTNGKYTPWLATGWTWGSNSTQPDLQPPARCRMVDGKPFTSADVVSTFQILKKYFGRRRVPVREERDGARARTWSRSVSASRSRRPSARSASR